MYNYLLQGLLHNSRQEGNGDSRNYRDNKLQFSSFLQKVFFVKKLIILLVLFGFYAPKVSSVDELIPGGSFIINKIKTQTR